MKKYSLIIFVLLITINSLISSERNELISVHGTKTIDEFELIEEKREGTRYPGGIFREISSGTIYLIKYSPLHDSIPEYISGEILSYILGADRVGRYEYIWDQNKSIYAIGSPWLPAFELFENLFESCSIPTNITNELDLIEKGQELKSCVSHGCEIKSDTTIERLSKDSPTSIEGKLLTGFDEVIMACIFVNDQDFNPSNFGFLKKSDRLVGAKIDHGETLRNLDSPVNLAQIRSSMCRLGYWNWALGFDETLAALRKMGSFECLDFVIEGAVDYVAQYADIIEFIGIFKIEEKASYTVDDVKEFLKNNFRIRQEFFRNMADSLEMEMAIKNNDLEGLKDLVNQGVPHDTKIYSFFNWKAPTVIFTPSKISSGWTIENLAEICQQEEPTTPLEYAKSLEHTEIADYLEEHAVCFVDGSFDN